MPVFIDASPKYRTFYVIFQDSPYKRPWHLFTHGRYKHCWLITPTFEGPPGLLTPQKTVRINALSNYVDVDYWDAHPHEVVKDFLKEENVVDIVKICLPLRKSVSYNLRGVINCITIPKAFMGINAWWIFTPQQLRRYLLKNGGQSMKGVLT